MFAFFLGLTALTGVGQDLGKVDPAVTQGIDGALIAYYSVKDALVDSDPELAAQKAAALLASIETVEVSKMNTAQREYWQKVSAEIRHDAEHMHSNKDIEHQRGHFAKLSNNMYALVFKFRANRAEAFLHYCPMKKASWLSSAKAVRNPYYGERMLTCGSVTATLNKN